jgi:hypothetical protein
MKFAWLILVLAPTVVRAQTPSVADVARQERARQKNLTSTVKVTNESLGTKVAEPTPAAPPAPAKAAAEAVPEKAAETPAEAATPPSSPAPHDEKSWRDAFKMARDDMKRADDRVQVLKLELSKLNMDLLTRDDIYNKEGQLVPKIAAKNTELAAAEKDADKSRKKVTQLEDDLRRSGSPIGWSR